MKKGVEKKLLFFGREKPLVVCWMTNGWKNPPNHFLCPRVPFPFYTWKKGGWRILVEKKQIVRDRSVFPLFTYEAKNVQPIVVVHTLKEIFVAVHVVGLYSNGSNRLIASEYYLLVCLTHHYKVQQHTLQPISC